MSLRIRVPLRFRDLCVAEDDFALVNRFAESRDESAFAGLVSRHARMVFGVCRRAVGDEHLAEDAFQAVFLVLARKPWRAATASSVGGWLFGIARRVGLAARRHELRRQKLLTSDRPDRNNTGESDFDDLLRVLDEELAALPEPYRAALVGCFLEEQTQDEAARQLNWSLSTLRRRLDRGKELLRARLLRRGVTLAAGLFAGALAPSARAMNTSKLIELASASSSQVANRLAAEVLHKSMALKIYCVAMVLAALGGLALGIGRQSTNANSEHIYSIMANTPESKGSPHADRLIERQPWVTLTGRVVYPEGRKIPEPRAVPATAIKDNNFFQMEVFHNDVKIDSGSRGIANVLVWLRPDDNDRNAQIPLEKINLARNRIDPVDRLIEVGREGCVPRVTGLRVGDRLVFTNPTPITFNVNYRHANVLESDNTGSFNVLLPSGKMHFASVLPTYRTPDFIKDNIHPWIQAHVRVFDHPYYCVTDERGNFRIEDAPTGSWRLVIWHEKIGYKGGDTRGLGEPIAIDDRGEKGLNLGRIVLDSDRWDEP